MAKQDTFVLDFYNSAADIKGAFDPFYTATSLTEPTDINVLHDLKDTLDETEIYTDEDVDGFNQLFFTKAPYEQLTPIIDQTVARFDLIEDEDDKVDFKIKAKQFVKIYAQLACIIPFENLNWEKLYWFLKFLVPKLKVRDKDKEELDALLESVDLSTYALERVRLNEHIVLDPAPSGIEPQNPNVRGHHGTTEEKSPLDEIVSAFNERWFSAWSATPEEQRVKIVNIVERIKQSEEYGKQVVDNPDEQNRRIALENLINQAVLAQRKTDMELYTLRQDDAFKQAFNETVMRILALEQLKKTA
jgi:type I restriction enzyme R subunit